MEKVVGKEFPLEKQRDMLEEMSHKLPLLYQNLVAAYGEEKGRAVYDDIFEVGFKKRSKMFEGKDIGNIMMYEIDMSDVDCSQPMKRAMVETTSK